MREFLSKSVAGGVRWSRPALVTTSWFVRGVAWTVLFELLLVALLPFERALWETAGGERVSSKVGAANLRLHSGSQRRKLSRVTALAGAAIFVPLVLLVTGLHQAPAHASTRSRFARSRSCA
jgi:hypothetical protein